MIWAVITGSGWAVKRFASASVVALVFTSAVTLSSTSAGVAADPRAATGEWSKPFEEDPGNVVYPVPADSANPQTSTEHCYIDTDPNHDINGQHQKVCKPTAVGITVLSDGRILYWNSLSGGENVQNSTTLEIAAVSTDSEARLLDLRSGSPVFSKPSPVSGGATSSPSGSGTLYPVPGLLVRDDPNATGDLFCSDPVSLADGRIAIAGGTHWYEQPNVPTTTYGVPELEGLKNTRIFNPATNTFSQAGDMNFARWYPTLVELSNSNIFVAGGVRRLITTDGTNVKNTEIFHTSSADPSYLKWTDNGSPGPTVAFPLFPRLQLLPNGHVYYTAVGQMWGPFGQSADELLYALRQSWDPKTNTWTDYGPGLLGARSGAFSSMLTLKAPYTHADILVGGGTIGVPPGTVAATNLTEIHSFDASSNWQASFKLGPSLQTRRWYGTSVILPNDAVAVFSGANLDEVVSPGSESAIRTNEWYTPWDGQFHNLSAGARDRTYHNTAVLLPDGSVLVGGHAPINNGYGKAGNNPSQLGTANNFKDPSFEIYKPPYFFQGARPQIEQVQSGIALGSKFTIQTAGAGPITSVRLIRLAALTHVVDANMRSVELPFKRAGNRLIVSAPPGNARDGSAVAPAGPYYLFINSGNGAGTVPSTAAIVNLGPTANTLSAALPFGGGAVATGPQGSLQFKLPAVIGALSHSSVGTTTEAPPARIARVRLSLPVSQASLPVGAIGVVLAVISALAWRHRKRIVPRRAKD